MTNLSQTCISILRQLADVVNQISSSDYSKPSDTLSKSTVGQHLRHTLEFFFCLESGIQCGVINYDKRAHDKSIETDKLLALVAINRISNFVEKLKVDSKITLEVGYDIKNEDHVTLETNASRELVYNIEHAVHHMAIMKIGIREVAPYVQIPEYFGIAASTVRYQKSAQKLDSLADVDSAKHYKK